MKKLSVSIILATCLLTTAFGQEKPQSQAEQKTPLFSMNGGVWFGMNETTRFVGFIGPKLSVTFPISKSMKLETGINGVPGLLLGKEPKLGLAAGGTITLKHSKTRFKPVFGVMFIKTDTWQTLYGIGFLF